MPRLQRARVGEEMTDYTIPRSVGAISVVPDMSEGPVAWWRASRGRPLYQSFASMRDSGLTAVGCLLRAHPTQRIWENIRRAMRTPGLDVIVITPLRWAEREWNYDHTVKNLRWENTPPEIFELLYRHYGHQEKTIIVQSLELDWTVAGIGCRADDRCIKDGSKYDYYLALCGDHVHACKQVKIDRAARLLKIMNERQAAAEAARKRHPNAKLKVYHAMQVNFFMDEFYLVARDLIPAMNLPPDLVGLSLYRKAGDPVVAYENVLEWTGLPADRVYVAEVGTREGTQRDGRAREGPRQYNRIVPIVDSLFGLGCPLAMVWSWEEVAGGGGHTGYAVNDAVTGEPLSGRTAIEELNRRWRNE